MEDEDIPIFHKDKPIAILSRQTPHQSGARAQVPTFGDRRHELGIRCLAGTVFLTFDERQARMAQEEGLEVLARRKKNKAKLLVVRETHDE